ncbi:MAG: divalent cation tolerance protein CutA [Alphaproteobacteria bacterium]|nr:divalent cation tolerance protein CutA [Alphaproteobacteria bacterium]
MQQINDTLTILYVTYSDAAQAEKHIADLLEARLIACANIIPQMTSFYWWQGKIEQGNELIVLFKTRNSLKQEVMTWLKRNHSYNTPCVMELPVGAVDGKYLQWILDETGDHK